MPRAASRTGTATVLLEPHEYARFRPFSVDYPVHNGAFRAIERVIPYQDGRCLFLGHDDLCTIYDDRPQSCRKFECVSGYPHSAFLKRNPHVRAVLDHL